MVICRKGEKWSLETLHELSRVSWHLVTESKFYLTFKDEFYSLDHAASIKEYNQKSCWGQINLGDYMLTKTLFSYEIIIAHTHQIISSWHLLILHKQSFTFNIMLALMTTTICYKGKSKPSSEISPIKRCHRIWHTFLKGSH